MLRLHDGNLVMHSLQSLHLLLTLLVGIFDDWTFNLDVLGRIDSDIYIYWFRVRSPHVMFLHTFLHFLPVGAIV